MKNENRILNRSFNAWYLLLVAVLILIVALLLNNKLVFLVYGVCAGILIGIWLSDSWINMFKDMTTRLIDLNNLLLKSINRRVETLENGKNKRLKK